jgi:hypothetical protein
MRGRQHKVQKYQNSVQRLHDARQGTAHTAHAHHAPTRRYLFFIVVLGAVIVLFLFLVMPAASVVSSSYAGCEVSQACHEYCKQIGLTTGSCRVTETNARYEWMVCACTK